MNDPTTTDSGIDFINLPREEFGDWYHRFVRQPWGTLLAVTAGLFAATNLAFGTTYWVVGGVANASSWLDCVFFSVQTLATIGYGVMAPTSVAAHALVTLEAFVGLLQTAIVTGLLFTRASLPRARVRFASRVCIAPLDGVPTLMIRAGNLRASTLIEAVAHVTLVRTERTAEGVTLYRSLELPLVRHRSASFTRAWLGLHRLDEASPLTSATPERLARDEAELVVSIVGIDSATGQTVHALARYEARDVVFGHRPADLMREQANGRLLLDLSRFDDVVPVERAASAPVASDLQR